MFLLGSQKDTEAIVASVFLLKLQPNSFFEWIDERRATIHLRLVVHHPLSLLSLNPRYITSDCLEYIVDLESEASQRRRSQRLPFAVDVRNLESSITKQQDRYVYCRWCPPSSTLSRHAWHRGCA